MKHTTILAAVSVALLAAVSASTGCSSSSTGSSNGGASSASHASSTTGSPTGSGGMTTTGSGGMTTSSTTAGTGGSSNPAPPAIGMQLDRMGRPAVNTALDHGFDSTAAAGTAKDAYNVDSDPTKWATNYTAEFEKNLAIIDALDGTCGNQLGYAKPAAATSYALIGGALTNDVVYLNTAGTTATQYLAVEANALNVAPNTDQGGRKLDYKVLDVTYSALAIGALTGVTNGITANDVAFTTTFPYEAAPH